MTTTTIPTTTATITPTPTLFAADAATARTIAMAQAMQQYVASTGDLTDETLLDSPWSFEFPGLARHAYLLPDFVLDTDGYARCVEANGSNGAGSSIHGRDVPRVRHEVETMRARGIAIGPDAVLLTPVSPDTRSTPEIHTRAALRAALVAEEYDVPVGVAQVGRGPLPDHAVAIWGPIPDLADHLVLGADGLEYDGRPVVFLNNVNLLVEMARRADLTVEQVLDLTTAGGRPDPVHDGAAMALLSLDKIRQQELVAELSSARPVAVATLSRDLGDIVTSALITAVIHGGAIIKPMAASGGTSVIPVDPWSTRAQVRAELDAAVVKLQAKYGDRWQATCPLAVFEFIAIQPAVKATGAHRWDLRLQVVATPERTVVTPLSARLCPSPIGPVLDRASGVNNLTGRTTSEANRLGVLELVDLVGAGPELLETFATAAYELTRAAVEPTRELGSADAMHAAGVR